VAEDDVVVDQNEELRLISTSETVSEWMNPSQILELKRKHINFMDITDLKLLKTAIKTPPIPVSPSYQSEVFPLLPKLNKNNVAATITKLSSYNTRQFQTATGEQAALWIRDEFARMAVGRSDIQVRLFPHTFRQPSVIATIRGTDPDFRHERVILGAHEDSLNQIFPTGRAPGADDDASGTATVLEVFRVIVESGFRPNRTLEFHTYAAEEGGLRGSAAIAQSYAEEGIVVAGMMQMDMVGYIGKRGPEELAIVTDFVNPALTEFVKGLVTNYATIPYALTACGYACSDHASWTKFNYASTFPFEDTWGDTNPAVHTTNDLLGALNLDHALQFAKVATGFVVELSHPTA
jgi:leucyl aminopeptidase